MTQEQEQIEAARVLGDLLARRDRLVLRTCHVLLRVAEHVPYLSRGIQAELADIRKDLKDALYPGDTMPNEYQV